MPSPDWFIVAGDSGGGGGSSGGGGDGASQWVQESLTGTRDGANTVFTLTWPPTVSPKTGHQIILLERNGVTLTPFPYASQGFATLGGEYSIVSNVVTFTTAPKADDYLIATYFPTTALPVTAAVLSVVTARNPGTAPSGDSGYLPVSAISLFDPTNPFLTGGIYSSSSWGSKPFIRYDTTLTPWATSTDTLALIPYPNPAYSGAYDYSSLAGLLSTLLVTFYQFNDEPYNDGNPDALFSIYAAYLDVTFSDGSTQRFWPQTTKLCDTSGMTPGPPTLGSVTNLPNAIDRDLATAAQIHGCFRGPLTAQPYIVQLLNFTGT
jgi:hypothetical protein